VDSHPPQLFPVVGVILDEQNAARIVLQVAHALEIGASFRLDRVDRDQDLPVAQREYHRNCIYCSSRIDRCEHTVPGGVDPVEAGRPVKVQLDDTP